MKLVLTSLCFVAACVAQDSLPPLKDGRIPTTLDELWAGYDPCKEPLEIEIQREWEEDGVVFRILRYTVGTFKGQKSRVLGIYGFPKGGAHLPALLHLHGGGQRANWEKVNRDARWGYASFSIGWGGNPLSMGRAKTTTYEGPNTDWGALDATHPPQRNKTNHFSSGIEPDAYTLDPVESPRNDNWFLVLIAARRALTFLEQQPEVNPDKLGVHGHSMGGRLTTCLAGIDKRVKAAVPSCGGSGTVLPGRTGFPGCEKKETSELAMACTVENPYIRRIRCPILFLTASNDFHARLDNAAVVWRSVESGFLQWCVSQHFNHRHLSSHVMTASLWFEQHLKGRIVLPKTPGAVVDFKVAGGIPCVRVTPDCPAKVRKVEVFYSQDEHTLTRFWQSSEEVTAVGPQWLAACPVMRADAPLFVFANVYYDTPADYRKLPQAAGDSDSELFVVSSYPLLLPAEVLVKNGAKASARAERMIDDGTHEWRDWYRLSWGHPSLWQAYTRKVKDQRWRGGDGARLVFDIQCRKDADLIVGVIDNSWGAFGRTPTGEYTTVRRLKGAPGWQTVSIEPGELVALLGKDSVTLKNWRTVTEFFFAAIGEVVRNGHKVKVGGKVSWEGVAFRQLRWEGGTY